MQLVEKSMVTNLSFNTAQEQSKTLIGFAIYAFWIDTSMPWYHKLAMSLIWGGGIGLFISVLRQRLIARKNDKYRRVKL